MKLPSFKGAFPLGKLEKAAKDAMGATERDVRVCVAVDSSVPTLAIEAVQALLAPAGDHATVDVLGFGPKPASVPEGPDLLLVLANDSACASHIVAEAIVAEMPAVVLAFDSAHVMEVSRQTSFALEDDDVVDMDAMNGFAGLSQGLAEWIVDNCEDSRVALAASFEFLRKPLALELAIHAATLCAAIGALPSVGGADMPAMVLVQGNMIVQMSAAYGYSLSKATIVQIAGTLPTAYVSRGVARKLVSRFPAVGWALRAGVAAASTLALGHAMSAYFENGGLPQGVKDAIANAANAAAETQNPMLQSAGKLAFAALGDESAAYGDASGVGGASGVGAGEFDADDEELESAFASGAAWRMRGGGAA